MRGSVFVALTAVLGCSMTRKLWLPLGALLVGACHLAASLDDYEIGGSQGGAGGSGGAAAPDKCLIEGSWKLELLNCGPETIEFAPYEIGLEVDTSGNGDCDIYFITKVVTDGLNCARTAQLRTAQLLPMGGTIALKDFGVIACDPEPGCSLSDTDTCQLSPTSDAPPTVKYSFADDKLILYLPPEERGLCDDPGEYFQTFEPVPTSSSGGG